MERSGGKPSSSVARQANLANWDRRANPLAAKSPDELLVSYSIEWNDPSPFDTQLNAHHAFINFAEILMYLPDRRAEDTAVTFDHLPAGMETDHAHYPRRKPIASLVAPSYDALVDAPVEVGEFGEFEFDNDGAHFRVAVDSKSGNAGHLENYLRQITGYELKLMGGPPFKDYTFLFHIGPTKKSAVAEWSTPIPLPSPRRRPKKPPPSPRTNSSTPGT